MILDDKFELFSNLPIRITTDAENDNNEQKEFLIHRIDNQNKKHKNTNWEERTPRYALAINSIMCTLFLFFGILGFFVLFFRIDHTISNIDAAVSFENTAGSMIRNVDSLLNTSASIAIALNGLVKQPKISISG